MAKPERHTIKRITIVGRSGGRSQIVVEDDQGVAHRHIMKIEAPFGWHGTYTVEKVGEATTMPAPLDEWIEGLDT